MLDVVGMVPLNGCLQGRSLPSVGFRVGVIRAGRLVGFEAFDI